MMVFPFFLFLPPLLLLPSNGNPGKLQKNFEIVVGPT